MTQIRHAKGSGSRGGQFAQSVHTEPSVSLPDAAQEQGRRTVTMLSSDDGEWGRHVELRDSRTGVLTDGPDGTAAQRLMHPNGALKSETHYIDGVAGTGTSYHENGAVAAVMQRDEDGLLADSPDGAPARTWFDPDGQLIAEDHYDGNRRVDQSDGTPAYRSYYPDGSVRMERWASGKYEPDRPPGTEVTHSDPRNGSLVTTSPGGDGRRKIARRSEKPDGAWEPQDDDRWLNDGPGGEPAVRYIRPDGSTSSITHYRNGRMGETIDYDRDGSVAAHYACSVCDQKPCVCGQVAP